MKNIKSSHVLYLVLNENGTLYCDKNKDYRIYKTINGLKEHSEKYVHKKIAVFTLTEIKSMEDILQQELSEAKDRSNIRYKNKNNL